MKRLIPLPITIALLASCTTVGPDYERPKTAIPDRFVSPAQSTPVDTRWWTSFGDPLLTQLIEDTAAHNLDIAEASARIREARALAEAARGGRLPEGAISAAITQNRLSEDGQIPVGQIPGFDRDFTLFDAGFDASYEIDLWGRNDRIIEASLADLSAAVETRRAVTLAALAETARAYMELRTAQAKAAILRDQLAALSEKRRLSELRVKAGEAPASESSSIVTRFETLAARLPPLEADTRVAAYRLALLTGRMPAELLERTAKSAALPELPVTVAAGLPSGLLERRPDIRACEARLSAATARVGVATADLFPRFSLLGSIGQQSRSADGLVNPDNTRFSLGPSFSWPLFQMGTIRANIRAADARVDAAAIEYERAILTALNESETALTRYAYASDSANRIASALASARRSEALAEQRYNAGEDNKLMLMDARIARADIQLQLVETHGFALQQLIAAYKALGGGWDIAETGQ